MLTLTIPLAFIVAVGIFAAGCIAGLMFIEWLDRRTAMRKSLLTRPKAWPASEIGLPCRRQEDQPKPAEPTKPHSMFDIESLQAARDLREWKP